MMDLGIIGDGVQVREFAIVIAAQNHNPTILNPDFLRMNGIAQADWKLAQAPICVEPMAQVRYTNGISVVSELQKIVFSQAAQSLTPDGIMIVEMAQQYVRAVPHVDYKGVGINPKGDIGFQADEGPRRYIMEKLIAQGPWQNYGEAPVRGSATLIFRLGEAQLFLVVQEANRKTQNGTREPVVIFSGNFNYNLTQVPRNSMVESLDRVLDNWRTCWSQYISLVNSIFCKEL